VPPGIDQAVEAARVVGGFEIEIVADEVRARVDPAHGEHVRHHRREGNMAVPPEKHTMMPRRLTASSTAASSGFRKFGSVVSPGR